jgi:hypothetical protein
MQQMNFLITALAALIPLIMGSIWYSKAVFGKAWMKAANINENDKKGGHMALTFILTYVLSFLLAIILNPIVIHQYGLMSVVAGDPGVLKADKASANYMWLLDAMDKYGHEFRTFKHGAFHATITAIMLVLPIIAINGMFERKGAKYIFINFFYWMVSMMLMGGVICQWT